MASEQRLIVDLAGLRWAGALLCAIAASLFGAGCASHERFFAPRTLSAPYPDQGRDVLWVVAPLRNESGVEGVDGEAIARQLAAALTETQGVAAAPVERTIETMRKLGVNPYDGAASARSVAEAMGADAVLVGAVTAYDPYDPPQLGLSLSLYARASAIRTPFKVEKEIDPLDIAGALSDTSLRFVEAEDPERPLSTVRAHFDAANHEVLRRVRAYAQGRHDEGASPLGWRRHTASMTLFTKFAAFAAVEQLLDAERVRLARQALAAELERRSQ